jgi:hypothetical protein
MDLTKPYLPLSDSIWATDDKRIIAKAARIVNSATLLRVNSKVEILISSEMSSSANKVAS